MSDLRFHEIATLQDELYDDWLDLYQTAFPLSEQVRISDFNRSLRRWEREQQNNEHFLAVLDEAGKLIAMSWYEMLPACAAAALWYLAVVPEGRSKGTGTLVYQAIRDRIAKHNPATKVLFFEVEDPSTSHSADDQQLATRRITFYQKNGAQLIRGIHYIQSVGWQPPIPMHLMAHPYQSMDVEPVFELAKCVFEEALQQTGPLSLE